MIKITNPRQTNFSHGLQPGQGSHGSAMDSLFDNLKLLKSVYKTRLIVFGDTNLQYVRENESGQQCLMFPHARAAEVGRKHRLGNWRLYPVDTSPSE